MKRWESASVALKIAAMTFARLVQRHCIGQTSWRSQWVHESVLLPQRPRDRQLKWMQTLGLFGSWSGAQWRWTKKMSKRHRPNECEFHSWYLFTCYYYTKKTCKRVVSKSFYNKSRIICISQNIKRWCTAFNKRRLTVNVLSGWWYRDLWFLRWEFHCTGSLIDWNSVFLRKRTISVRGEHFQGGVQMHHFTNKQTATPKQCKHAENGKVRKTKKHNKNCYFLQNTEPSSFFCASGYTLYCKFCQPDVWEGVDMCQDHLRSKTHVNNEENSKLPTQTNGKIRVKGTKNRIPIN